MLASKRFFVCSLCISTLLLKRSDLFLVMLLKFVGFFQMDFLELELSDALLSQTPHRRDGACFPGL